MNTSEIRQRYLEYFKKQGHAIVPSCGLVPDNDPSTLFTSAGMQQMIPYLSGQNHPLGLRIANSQKCLRTQDIEEVGDNRHMTFFEMLGNWSLNDFFKKEQITWMFEFLTKEVGLDPQNIYVTAFGGSPECGIPRDTETAQIWKELFLSAGIEARDVEGGKNELQRGEKIFYYDESKNWWSRSGKPAGMPEGELGGPDSEMFWDFGATLSLHENSQWAGQPCHVNCDCGRFLEIGNNVFMEYIKRNGRMEKMARHNVDFGGGLERIAAASINNPDAFKTDLFSPIIKRLEQLSGKKYGVDTETTTAMRVIADHIRSAVFLIADNVVPSNKAQGYFTRRLIRRAVFKGQLLGIEKNYLFDIAQTVGIIYGSTYHLPLEVIKLELDKEETKFRKTLIEGKKILEKYVNDYIKKNVEGFVVFNDLAKKVLGEELDFKGGFSFYLYESFGFPPELTLEELKKYPQVREKINDNEYWEHFNMRSKEHQDLSRTASAGMFKGGLADASEQTTKLHTAAHLMLAALRRILGDQVFQKGSNITAERLRFDFSYPQKMTSEEIRQVEDLVNGQIQKNIMVGKTEMNLNEARDCGAMGVFGAKYGARVTVYTIGDFSKEICGGPHVDSTGKLGHFKIAKEESSSSGVRRIKAVLE